MLEGGGPHLPGGLAGEHNAFSPLHHGPTFTAHPGYGTTNIHIHPGGGAGVGGISPGLAASEERLLAMSKATPEVAKKPKSAKMKMALAGVGGAGITFVAMKMGGKGHDQKVAQDAAEAQMQQDDEAYKAQQDQLAKQQQQQAAQTANTAQYAPASYSDPYYADPYANTAPATTPAPAPAPATTPAPTTAPASGGKGKATPQRRSLIEVSSLIRRSYDVIGKGSGRLVRRSLESAGEATLRLVHVGHDEKWGPLFRAEHVVTHNGESRGRSVSRHLVSPDVARPLSPSPEPLHRRPSLRDGHVGSAPEFLSAHSSPTMTPEHARHKLPAEPSIVPNGIPHRSEIEEIVPASPDVKFTSQSAEATSTPVSGETSKVQIADEGKTVPVAETDAAGSKTPKASGVDDSKAEKEKKKKKKKLPWGSMLAGGAVGLYVSKRDVHEPVEDLSTHSQTSAKLALHPRISSQDTDGQGWGLLSKRETREMVGSQSLEARDGAEVGTGSALKQPVDATPPTPSLAKEAMHEAELGAGKAHLNPASNISPVWGMFPGQHVGRLDEHEALIRDNPGSKLARMGYIPRRYNFDKLNSKSDPFQKFASIATGAVRHEQSAHPKPKGSFGAKGLGIALLAGGAIGGLLALPRPNKRSIQESELAQEVLQARSLVRQLDARGNAILGHPKAADYYIVPRTVSVDLFAYPWWSVGFAIGL